MHDSLTQARARVHTLFSQLLALVDSDSPLLFSVVEAQLWSTLLAFGRALLSIFLLRQALRLRAVMYQFDHKIWQLSEPETTTIFSRFGKLRFTRKVGRIPGNKRLAADTPIDRELGLAGSFSQGFMSNITKLCAQMSFSLALAQFKDTYEWAPARNTVLRIVDYVGGAAKDFLSQLPAPENDGEILVLEADGKGIPHLFPRELERRKQPHRAKSGAQRAEKQKHRKRQSVSHKEPGRKGHSKNAKVAFIGVVYTLKQTETGLSGPINKRVFATFESHDALFKMLKKEALKRGYGSKPTLFLGDGSEHIWRCQKEYFPLALAILDWYHGIEKIWETGRALHQKQEKSRLQWVYAQIAKMREGKIEELILLLQNESLALKAGAERKVKREALKKLRVYLEEHKERMRYGEYRDWGLVMGSGAVEGAVRNAAGMRQDGPGMRWGRGRDELILQLRCIVLNGQWSDFEKFVEKWDTRKLRPRPIPAIAYEARAAA